MKSKKAARDCCNNRRAKTSTLSHRDDVIITYERGARIAGYMFCAMFVVLTLGVVMFQW